MELHEEKLKQLLNRDKIKLWEEPYTLEDGTRGVIPEVSF